MKYYPNTPHLDEVLPEYWPGAPDRRGLNDELQSRVFAQSRQVVRRQRNPPLPAALVLASDSDLRPHLNPPLVPHVEHQAYAKPTLMPTTSNTRA